MATPILLLEQIAEEFPDTAHSLAEGIADSVHWMERAGFFWAPFP